MKAIASLGDLKPANGDQEVGINIIRQAIQAPARQIAINAGDEGAVIVGKLMESKDAKRRIATLRQAL